tara:strand:+ start:2169 stop:3377 length:1209 start_codon:yes stop_codon:yes gene_type:complete
MAIKLTDIVTVMKSKWTYGDKFFGYTEEFNDNHNTQYPSILITPPTSVFPEVGLNNGWENYTFEIYFSDLYNRTAQANEAIDQRWENLQDLATEWLDNFLKHYQANAPILAFLEDESVTLERNKEVANDQLLQIKMTFSWRVLSKCFRPQSTYPNEISGLSSWLRADSNVTFSIPTKEVSAIGDGSGNGNGVLQSTSNRRPLRYTYGGGVLDKTMLAFGDPITRDVLVSSNNFITDGTTAQEFTIFEVSKINKISDAVFGYFHLTDGSYIEMGTNAAGKYGVSVSDGTTTLLQETIPVVTGNNHIAVLRKQNRSIYFSYYDSTYSNDNLHNYNAAFDLTASFENESFRIGGTRHSDGLIPPASVGTRYLHGDFQEAIIYDRKLSDIEMAKVVDYLNKKYKIY